MKKKFTKILPILVLIGLVIYALTGCKPNHPTENMHKFKTHELVVVDNEVYSVKLATEENTYYLQPIHGYNKNTYIIVNEQFITKYNP